MKQNFYSKTILLIIILTFAACGGGGGDESSNGGGGSVIDIEMVQLSGGKFIMGSPTTEANRDSNESQHSVEVSSFSMSKFPVTQGVYKAVMDKNPSFFQGAKLPAGFTNGNLPVENVTWYDAVEFCNELSKKNGFTPVYKITVINRNPNGNITSATIDDVNWSADGYRLPTEAEWEYACRGNYTNKETEYATMPFGVGIDGRKMTYELANFNTRYPYDLDATPTPGEYNDPLAVDIGRTTEVGSYAANGYGLYDMHGNVFEWCWDLYDADYNKSFNTRSVSGAVGDKDPAGLVAGSSRVRRGGSWSINGPILRSARRALNGPDSLNEVIGFRVVQRP